MWTGSISINLIVLMAPSAHFAEDFSDEELCGHLAHHDEEALAALYDRTGPQAFRVATRIVGSREAAEDIVQTAFMKLWHAPETYRYDRGSFSTWFMRIVSNLAIDQVRRNASRSRLNAVIFNETLVQDQVGDPWDEVVRRLAHADVHNALRALPGPQRQVLRLAYFEGRTVPQIAVLTDLPITTVKGRLRLALGRMRREMSPSLRLTKPADQPGWSRYLVAE